MVGVTQGKRFTSPLRQTFSKLQNEKAKRPLELRYSKSGIGIGVPGSFFHVLIIWPKKTFIPIRLGVSNAEQWMARFDDVGIEAKAKRSDQIVVRLTATDLAKQEGLDP